MGTFASAFSQSKIDSSAVFLNDKPFVNWAKEHAAVLQQSDSAIGYTDLVPLNKMIGNAKVVALGEPAHGFHEPLAFRNRLFRYLAENCGFTTIVLEAGFAQSRAAVDYVAGGQGTAREAAAKLSIAGAAPETIALLEWIRAYNADPAHTLKLHFYGMDIELVGFPGDTVRSDAALGEALTYLKRVDSAQASKMIKALTPYLARISVARYPLLNQEEHNRLSAIIDELIALFVRERINYISLSSIDAYEWGRHNAVVAQQTDRMVRISPPDQPGKIPADAWQAVNARDAAMAENVKWILQHRAGGGKVLIFAHNAHIKNETTVGGVWDAFAKPPKATGQYLRSMLGNEIFIIGSSIEPNTSTAEPGSVDNALTHVGIPRFILDIRTATSHPQVASWLSMQRPMQANKFSFFRVHTAQAFDAVLFIEKAK
jgi:erythromycin esterase